MWLKLVPKMSRMFFSTSNSPKSSFFVTTPIFYVNANPHLGHLYSMLLSDVRHRWAQLDPKCQLMFITGTDEHGLKIQAAAEKENLNPKQLVDRVSQNFRDLASIADINYDRFIRTTDSDHIEAVKHFWNVLEHQNLIYTGEHSGWYSISDETFYPEAQIQESNGKMICKETGTEVKYHSETNYFFKLGKFQHQLIEFLQQNPGFIIPESKYHEVLRELTLKPLQDLSVSRPSSRLKWAIDVPGDSSQKIYVWFDALINYITVCGYPNGFVQSTQTQNPQTQTQDPQTQNPQTQKQNPQTQKQNFWPATHVIGKDIIRFHCIYWPIFLMAAKIDLPQQVIVHSHWLSNGVKMSKSIGNVVDPMEMIEKYGQDCLRFFLMEFSNINHDCNYTETHFKHTRDNIIGKYANLMTRIGGKAFNIEQSIKDLNQGNYESIDDIIKARNPEKGDDIIITRNTLLHSLKTIYDDMNEDIIKFDYMKAIQRWWQTIELGNQWLQVTEPWKYNKEIKKQPQKELQLMQNYYIMMAAETVRIGSILIEPIMPQLAGRIMERMKVGREWREVFKGGDYGEGANGKHKMPIERV